MEKSRKRIAFYKVAEEYFNYAHTHHLFDLHDTDDG